MSRKEQVRPTIEEIRAAAPADRLNLIRAFTAPVFAEAQRRRDAGICSECDLPVCGVGDIGDTYCAEHAREVELEWLECEQRADDGGE